MKTIQLKVQEFIIGGYVPEYLQNNRMTITNQLTASKNQLML